MCVFITGANKEKTAEMSQVKLEKRFGTSPVFIASTVMENGGVLINASPASLLSEAIQVISCGYEDKTEWGKEVSFSFMFCNSILLACCVRFFPGK